MLPFFTSITLKYTKYNFTEMLKDVKFTRRLFIAIKAKTVEFSAIHFHITRECKKILLRDIQLCVTAQ